MNASNWNLFGLIAKLLHLVPELVIKGVLWRMQALRPHDSSSPKMRQSVLSGVPSGVLKLGLDKTSPPSCLSYTSCIRPRRFTLCNYMDVMSIS